MIDVLFCLVPFVFIPTTGFTFTNDQIDDDVVVDNQTAIDDKEEEENEGLQMKTDAREKKNIFLLFKKRSMTKSSQQKRIMIFELANLNIVNY